MSTKACPECGEEIQAAAKKCRFCGERFDGAVVSPVAPAPAPPSAPKGGARSGLILAGMGGVAVLVIGVLLVAKYQADQSAEMEAANRQVAEDRLVGDAANRLVEDQRLAAEATARRLEEERMAAIAAENARKQAECEAIREDAAGQHSLDSGTSTLLCMHPSASNITGSVRRQVDACSDAQNYSGSESYVLTWDGMVLQYTTEIRVEWKVEGGAGATRTRLVSDNATINAEPGCIADYWQGA